MIICTTARDTIDVVDSAYFVNFHFLPILSVVQFIYIYCINLNEILQIR